MKQDKWENFGDIGHKEYGGLFIKRESGSKTEYRVVETIPADEFDGEEADGNYITDGLVDLSDSWIKWEDVASTVGMTEQELRAAPAKIQVMEVWRYYGHSEFNGCEPYQRITDGYSKTLKAFGIRIPSR